MIESEAFVETAASAVPFVDAISVTRIPRDYLEQTLIEFGSFVLVALGKLCSRRVRVTSADQPMMTARYLRRSRCQWRCLFANGLDASVLSTRESMLCAVVHLRAPCAYGRCIVLRCYSVRG